MKLYVGKTFKHLHRTCTVTEIKGNLVKWEDPHGWSGTIDRHELKRQMKGKKR